MLMEAMATTKQATLEGGLSRYSEATGRFEIVPFSQLNRTERAAVLGASFEWNLFIEHGKVAPENLRRMIENAADGMPQERWLEEPLVTDEQRHGEQEARMREAFGRICGSNGGHQRDTDMKLAERLASYAGPEPVQEEISRGREC